MCRSHEQPITYVAVSFMDLGLSMLRAGGPLDVKKKTTQQPTEIDNVNAGLETHDQEDVRRCKVPE